ncbi:MAG TPA: hypothetical protein VNN19_00065 [bacterium]|nr:hypothetical protein [bacterium]
MAYVRTIPPDQAQGEIAELYEQDRRSAGGVANFTQMLSLRPDILRAYRALGAAIRSHLDVRQYELITTVAAARLRCSY